MYMGLMGQGRDRPAHRGLVRPSTGSPREGKGGGLSPLSFPSSREKGKGRGRHLLLPSPSAKTRKGGGRIGVGAQVGLGLLGRPLAASSPLQPIYMWGEGAPRTHKFLLTVCCAPLAATHLGHIVVVLRRSPMSVTSSSPSPRRRADGTVPRPQLGQEIEGRHRAEHVLNSEVPYVRC